MQNTTETITGATNVLSAKLASTPVISVPVVVSVHIVMYDDSGPRSMFGGVCPVLALALSDYSSRDGSGITRRSDVFEPVGQDIFEASYDAVLRLRGLFSFLSFPELDKLHDTWPETFNYAFIVTR